MEDYPESGSNDGGSFVDINEAFPVELCWTPLKRRSFGCLLQRAEGEVPIMSIRTSSSFRSARYPIRIDCHDLRGTITSEWIGEKPSILDLLFSIVLAFFDIASRYQPCKTLRRRGSDEIVAVYWATGTPDGSIDDWRGHITVQNKEYQMRMDYVHGPWRYAFYGHRFTVSDQNGDVATAVVNHNEPQRGRIAVVRNMVGIEAVLAFLFLEAREAETHDPD